MLTLPDCWAMMLRERVLRSTSDVLPQQGRPMEAKGSESSGQVRSVTPPSGRQCWGLPGRSVVRHRMTADKDFKQLVRTYARSHRTSYASARQRLLASTRAPETGAPREDPSMKFTTIAPVLRTFDTDKATEFYVDYLGMSVDWEHRFEPHLPLYRQVSRGDLVLHLTEHHGDSTPGAVVYIYMVGIRDLHEELAAKSSVGHNNPGLEAADGRTEFSVVDPFGNRLRFGERTS